MAKKILSYQIKAAKQAIKHLQKNQNFNLQAPTGSGKTMITGMMIENIITDPSFQLEKKTFIFVAPSNGALDEQGYEKITNYLKRDWLKGFTTEYIGTSGGRTKASQYLQNIEKFENNKLYFIGWSLFAKNSNLSKIDSEKNNILRVIQNTESSGNKIILIVDEAHREFKNKSYNKQMVLDSMNPFRTILISATLDNSDYIVTIDEVREEAAIKKNVVIDMGEPEFGYVDNAGEIFDLLSAATKKQKEIKVSYNKKGINDNPLILIQIPDKNTTTIKNLNKKIDDYYIEHVKVCLKKLGYKLGLNAAIWLYDNKTTKDKEEITKNNSSFEVLVFKQAIATGWDIPRANILVRLREPKSPKFDIQTLGRILRNPRFKYFNNKLIDNAFVFTRDDKYYQKIKNLDFIQNTKEKVNIPLSQLGKNSKLSIKKLVYSKPIIDDDVIKYIFDELVENKKNIIDFINSVKEIAKHYNRPLVLNSKLVFKDNSADEIQSKTNINKKFIQQNFVLDKSLEDDLFNIYIKFVASFENKNLGFHAFELFLNKLSKTKEIKKKHIYKKIISVNFFEKTNHLWKNKTFIEYIDDLKNSAIKELSEVKYEDYVLNNEFRYNSNDIDLKKHDEVNTYDMSIKKWDSNIEANFYKKMMSEIKNASEHCKRVIGRLDIHIFRNGIDDRSYFINYYDENDKLLKFYPDFILIDDFDKKAYVMETKGRKSTGKDIDKNSNYKFYSAWQKEGDLRSKYTVKVLRVEPSRSGDDFILWKSTKENITLSKFWSELSNNRMENQKIKFKLLK